MILLYAVVVCLAVWRVSNLLSDTTQVGPFGVLEYIRTKLGVRYDQWSKPFAPKGSIAEAILCVYCNSVWVGLVFTIALLCNQKVTVIASLPLALSAVAIIIDEWRNKNGD
jgi:hypothetical protein